MVKRPKIGLSTRLELDTRRFYLARDYSDAVYAAGGLPVHIPLIPEPDYIDNIVEDLDGILLGGADCDPDPELYGEDPHPKLGRVIKEKDRTDLLLLEAAEKRELPVMGICFGLQILNVFRGGSLIQDIESQVDGAIRHKQGQPLAEPSHYVAVEPQSRLSALLKEAGKDDLRLKVTSHHHQAIRLTGKNLRVVARTAEGVIEAVEDEREGRVVVGFQWHPELTWSTDPVSRSIFKHFIDACG